jgi:hypothetical protein
MRVFNALLIASGMFASTHVFAADYHAAEHYEPRQYSAPRAAYAGSTYVPYVAPVYLMPSPPQYVQDLRTGAPGRWVQLKPSFFDRLFGELRDGY